MKQIKQIKPIPQTRPNIKWIPKIISRRLTYGNYCFKYQDRILLLSNRPVQGQDVREVARG